MQLIPCILSTYLVLGVPAMIVLIANIAYARPCPQGDVLNVSSLLYCIGYMAKFRALFIKPGVGSMGIWFVSYLVFVSTEGPLNSQCTGGPDRVARRLAAMSIAAICCHTVDLLALYAYRYYQSTLHLRRVSHAIVREPTIDFSTIDIARSLVTNSEPCSICLEELSSIPLTSHDDDQDASVDVGSLPCHHRFHYHCIRSWLMTQDQPSCPVCRSNPLHVATAPVAVRASATPAATVDVSNNV